MVAAHLYGINCSFGMLLAYEGAEDVVSVDGSIEEMQRVTVFTSQISFS